MKKKTHICLNFLGLKLTDSKKNTKSLIVCMICMSLSLSTKYPFKTRSARSPPQTFQLFSRLLTNRQGAAVQFWCPASGASAVRHAGSEAPDDVVKGSQETRWKTVGSWGNPKWIAEKQKNEAKATWDLRYHDAICGLYVCMVVYCQTKNDS